MALATFSFTTLVLKVPNKVKSVGFSFLFLFFFNYFFHLDPAAPASTLYEK